MLFQWIGKQDIERRKLILVTKILQSALNGNETVNEPLYEDFSKNLPNYQNLGNSFLLSVLNCPTVLSGNKGSNPNGVINESLSTLLNFYIEHYEKIQATIDTQMKPCDNLTKFRAYLEYFATNVRNPDIVTFGSNGKKVPESPRNNDYFRILLSQLIMDQ